MANAAVVGNGLLGLAVAQRLQQRGDDVAVLSTVSRSAGPRATSGEDDNLFGHGYHVTLPSDARTRQMLRSIGIEGELRWRRTSSALHAGPGGEAIPLSDVLDLARLRSIGPMDKLRVASTVARAARAHHWDRLEARPAATWLSRHSGARTFEKLWHPLLRADLGECSNEASAAFACAMIQRHVSSRPGWRRAEQLGYVPGGHAHVFDRFAAELTDRGVKVDTTASVKGVRRTAAGLRVDMDGGSAAFDRVVLTVSSHEAADLCPDLNAAEDEQLRAVQYGGLVCLSVLLRRRISPFHRTVLSDPSSPFTAVVEMTPFIDPSELGGQHLVHLPRPVRQDDPLLDADDESVAREFLPYLRRMYPSLAAHDISPPRVSRIRPAFAVPTLGHSRRMPPTMTSVKGLQLIGTAHLAVTTLSTNDSLALLEELR